MYLTRQADYTMRLLIHLALQPDRTATIAEVAEHYGISGNHLVKVAHHAIHAGFVAGTRGRGGGIRLAKNANEIGIGEVLRAVEDWKIVECFDPTSNTCQIAGVCGLQSVLKEAMKAWFAVLDKYTLADVIRRKTLLVELLSLGTARHSVGRRS